MLVSSSLYFSIYRAIEREYAEVRILRRNLDVGLGKAQSVLEETQVLHDSLLDYSFITLDVYVA